MADENAVAVREPDVSMKEFGSREDVAALSRRIVTMMPGGNKLTPEQALATAQYAMAIGANPFHDIYAFEDKGQLRIVEHYRLIVSWAKAKCDYSEWFTPIEDLPETQVGFWCHIIREDKQALLDKLLTHGMDLERAMDIVSTRAGGVANKSERVPKGWTIADVAQKRALKNALNRSHGAPTPAEIARESWNVNGRKTQAEDWEDVTAEMTRVEAEATADYSARERERHAAPATVENAQDAITELYPDDTEPPTQEPAGQDTVEPVTESEPEPPAEPPDEYVRVPYGGKAGKALLEDAVAVMPFKAVGEAMTVLNQVLGADWRKESPEAQWQTLDDHCASADQADQPMPEGVL